MDDRIRVSAERAARHLLQRYREEHPYWTDDCVPVHDIASWLGLQVETFHPSDYPPGTYGFLEAEEDLIWLCRDLSETLRRFTLAHELGHAILHCPHKPWSLSSMPLVQEGNDVSRDDPCQQPDVREEVAEQLEQDYMEEVLGIGMSYHPRSQRELAANIFAAELLMPLERVKQLYLQEQQPAYELATCFAVSQSALLNRLVGLLNETAKPASAVDAPENPPTTASAKKRYDEFQQAAIETPTPALIVAGPGSGKTSTLIGCVEYLIDSLHVSADNILALTFSRKAAEEMRERLQAVLPASTRLPTVSTFHAFCAEILRGDYAQLVGLRRDFTLLDEVEGYVILRQLAPQMHLQHYRNVKAPAYYFPDMLKAISRARDELVGPDEYQRLAEKMLENATDEETQLAAEKALEMARVYRLYDEALLERGDTDFGGLILLAVRLLTDYPEIRMELHRKYQHILVDEFQDMNRASGVLLRLLAGEQRNVWVVGDANQAIYGFRGASPANITNFEEDYPGAVVLPLSRNYRSLPDIVALAESFRYHQLELGAEVEPRKNEPVRLTPEDTTVTLAVAEDAVCELAGIVADIRAKHIQGYAYRDMVVLCRTRALARKVTRALLAAGLPVIESSSMLQQEHIKNLLSIVLLLAEEDMGILRAARQEAHPLSQRDIEALVLAAHEQKCSPVSLLLRGEIPATISKEGQEALQRLSQSMQVLLTQTKNIWSLLAQYLLMETPLIRNLLREPDNKVNRSILADYTSMLHLARRYDQQQAALRRQRAERSADGEPEEPPPLVEQVKGFLDYLRVLLTLGQDGSSRQQGAEENEEEEQDIIRVMTVHASKGLEFPVVYLPNLLQQRFPLQNRSSSVALPTGLLAEEHMGKAAHESGESCLFYVGVTRARDQLILSYSKRYGKRRATRSPFLDALVAGVPPERIRQVEWHGASGLPETDEEEIVALSQPGEDFITAMKPRTMSATDIESYQRCPRQYAYGSIYRFRSSEATYQLFWRATQRTFEALKHILEEVQKQPEGTRSLPSAEEARELYARQWQELEGHTFPFASMYEQHGYEVIELLRRRLLESKDAHWELRQTFTVDIAGRDVHVPVDRVETSATPEEPKRFVRTQFGKRKEKPAASTREYLYTRAYRQLHPGQDVALQVHNLSTGETFPLTMTPKKESSLQEEIEQSLLGLERNEYPPKPDERMCPTCPFFLICPA